MEYAVIVVGNIQYRVAVGDIITTELAAGTEEKEVIFDKVLLLKKNEDITVGKPYLDIFVKGVIEDTFKEGKKVGIRYEHKVYRRSISHRQTKQRIKIIEIDSNKGK